jgi:hypothetical protein
MTANTPLQVSHIYIRLFWKDIFFCQLSMYIYISYETLPLMHNYTIAYLRPDKNYNAMTTNIELTAAIIETDWHVRSCMQGTWATGHYVAARFWWQNSN